MQEQFDPYFVWLGIRPEEQPVDHYRLLGLTRYESDGEAIAAAADSRMLYLRSMQMGPRGKYTQEVLNRLSKARRCLLDPAAKIRYDQRLRAAERASERSSPPAPASQNSPLDRAVDSAIVRPTGTAGPAPPPAHYPRAQLESRRGPTLFGDERDEGMPWYARAVFPIAVVAGIVVVATLAWAAGRTWQVITARGATASVTEQATGRQTQPEAPAAAQPEIDVRQDGAGNIHFAPQTALVEGPSIERVAVDGSYLVQSWRSTEDAAHWAFRVFRPDIFRIEITYAVPQGDAGGTFELVLDDQVVRRGRTRATGGSDSFVTDEYFVAVRRSGMHRLTLRAAEIPGRELMRLRSIHFFSRSASRQ